MAYNFWHICCYINSKINLIYDNWLEWSHNAWKTTCTNKGILDMCVSNNTLKLAITSILLTATSSLYAAPTQVTYDFTSGGSPSSPNTSGYGNSLLFSDIDSDNSSTENLTITAWGGTGPDQGGAWGDSLETGEIYRWGTGLGACNRSEGTIGGGCNTNYQHQVDNYSYDDMVLFVFDNTMTFNDIVVDPYLTTDTDVTFWIGNITSSDLTGLDDVTLLTTGGFSSPIDQLFYGATTTPQTIDLFGGLGNALLIGGQRDSGAPDDDDFFKISSLTVTTTVVPVPAAVWLFGSGLIGLAGFARRKSLS
jgi:hypothetical protein